MVGLSSMTTLLILTGPQGSGNHLFSKLFALHPEVNGWKELNETYWIGHDQEPFAKYWKHPENIKDYNWDSHEYHVTSISCPYRYNGDDAIPNYKQFIDEVVKLGIIVKIAVIGRDQNILDFQEQRLRDRVTYTEFLKELLILESYDPVYISQELVYLYKQPYLKQLSKQLNFPIKYQDPTVNCILNDNSNKKYFKSAESTWLDPLVKQASSKHSDDK